MRDTSTRYVSELQHRLCSSEEDLPVHKFKLYFLFFLFWDHLSTGFSSNSKLYEEFS